MIKDAVLVLLVAVLFYRAGVQDGYHEGWSDYEGTGISCTMDASSNGQVQRQDSFGWSNEQRPN